MNSLSQSSGGVYKKKQRFGRWTNAEINLFQQLIQKYGKNWKKIQTFIKGRTLSQIRSHAQKFFQRIGPIRAKEYQRKAKILSAIEVLENQKLREKKQMEEQSSQEQKINELSPRQDGKNITLNETIERTPGIKNSSEQLRKKIVKEQFQQNYERASQAPFTKSLQQVHNIYQHQSYYPIPPIFWVPSSFPWHNPQAYQPYNYRLE